MRRHNVALGLSLLAGLPMLSAALFAIHGERGLAHVQAWLVILGFAAIPLAVAVNRSIVGSAREIVDVARRVQQERDFSLRAEGTSLELYPLVDAFNHMLSAIEARDHELAQHRENLEQSIAARTYALWTRTEQMRLVLDTVDTGLATLDQRGRICPERSRAFDAFFGTGGAGVPYFKFLAGDDDRLASALELDWWQISEGSMPLEVALAQANNRLAIGGKQFSLHYKPISTDGKVTGALLTIENVTGQLDAQRAEAAQREQAKIFSRIMKDRAAFVDFFQEAQRLVDALCERRMASPAEKMHALHTLKGNAAQSDALSVAEPAHALEQTIIDCEPLAEAAATNALARAWQTFSAGVLPLLGGDLAERYELSGAEMEQLRLASRERRWQDLEQILASIQGETVGKHFARVIAQLKRVSLKLGKGEPEVSVSGTEIRLPHARFAPLWSAFVHVVNNVADHGLQSCEERLLAGKSPRNRVALNARVEQGHVVIEVSDDGRGIDWRKVEDRAHQRGWPHETRAQLVAALFAPGFSTVEATSEVSGRGVGMSALLEACVRLDGECVIDSVGRGTQLTVRLPLEPRLSRPQLALPAAL